jgi:hypothetical protein
MAGVEECGLARAQVFHAAPTSLFSAAQNSLSAPYFTETGGRSDILAGRLLPSRLPSQSDPVGLNPRMSLAPASSTLKIETRRYLPKMNGVRGRGRPHQPEATTGSPMGSGVRTDGGNPKPGPNLSKDAVLRSPYSQRGTTGGNEIVIEMEASLADQQTASPSLSRGIGNGSDTHETLDAPDSSSI